MRKASGKKPRSTVVEAEDRGVSTSSAFDHFWGHEAADLSDS